jgi:hypothetical protein
MPAQRAPWWLYLIAASFLGFLAQTLQPHLGGVGSVLDTTT